MSKEINLKDVRLGNSVLGYWTDDEGEVHSFETKITGLDSEGNLGEGYSFMVEINDPDSDYLDGIKAIDLTDDKLLELGCFKPSDDDPYGGMLYRINSNSCIRILNNQWEWDESYCNSSIELKYVHQFQNLIFILTGNDI